MNKIQYTKPPLTVHEHIKLLKTRGLQIPDDERATRYLQNISYFHLSGYMYPFLIDKKQHIYKTNSSFDDIINLYRFEWLISSNLSNDKMYVVLAVIAYFLDTITPTNTFRDKLKYLLAKYPNIDITAMGFPKDWKNNPFWGGISE